MPVKASSPCRDTSGSLSSSYSRMSPWRGLGWSIAVPTPHLILLPSSRASLAPGREHTPAKGVLQHCWPSYSGAHPQHQPGWWGTRHG